jgi:hypothetical protein
MTETLEAYRALSSVERRAVDLFARTGFNNRTVPELLAGGFKLSVERLMGGVSVGLEMLADGFTEKDAAAVAAAGR